MADQTISPYRAECLLLDIEGTISAIDFVHQVMYGYARTHLVAYLTEHWADPATQHGLTLLARDLGHADLPSWLGTTEPTTAAIDMIQQEVARLMADDVKATGLKELQGLIWRGGFQNSTLQAHLFDDVPVYLRRWHAEGRQLRIYSSGSIAAQQMFLAHTQAGDLLDMFSGHYDTTTGPKKEPASYTAIIADIGLPAAAILFLSDSVAELDAAASAGLTTGWMVRPGNPTPSTPVNHPAWTDFSQIPLQPLHDSQ